MSKDGVEKIKPECEKNISGGVTALKERKISEEFKEKIINSLMNRPVLLKAYGGPRIEKKAQGNKAIFLPRNLEEEK